MRPRIQLCSLLIFAASLSMVNAQPTTFPYRQSFDSVAAPLLPSGWSSSQNRNPGTNDFTTTTSTPRSVPNTMLSTNATIAQELLSPLFNFKGELPDSIFFHTRRSSSHNAKVVLEASLNGGIVFPVLVGDTLTFNGSTNYVASHLALPETLSSSSSVRFRWRVIPDQTGSTGTFRLDDVYVSIQSMHDLGIDTIVFIPHRPIEGDSIVVRLLIRNNGLVQSSQFGVSIFQDANGDSITQSDELVTSSTVSQTIEPNDIDSVDLPIGIRSTGTHVIIGRIEYESDRNVTNNEALVPLTIGFEPGTIVINEIMYAPTGTEPEWIELYNAGTDTIDVRDWLISDNVISSKKIIASSGMLLAPHAYLVLTKDSSAFFDIHPEVISRVLHIPALPTLNNSGDAVVLYDDRIATMDSLTYHPSWGGNAGGKSLERIEAVAPSTSPLNWGSSRGSTPGRRNSISRKDVDLMVDTVLTHPEFPIVGDSLILYAKLRNAGFLESSMGVLRIYRDLNNDSTAQQDELLASQPVFPMTPLDSILVAIHVAPLRAGTHNILVWSDIHNDEDSTNDISHTNFIIGYPEGSIKLNEVMYAPSSGGPEWIELVSAGEDTLFLEQWSLSNRSTSRYETGDSIITVPPGVHVILTKDSSHLKEVFPAATNVVHCPSLPTFLWNNSGDAVVLRDNRGLVMDSLYYSSTWGGLLGRSLERMDIAWPNDSVNWCSSEDSVGATPGQANSVVRLDHDLRILAEQSITVFPGESAPITFTTMNAGKQAATLYTAIFFYDADKDSQAAENEEIARLQVVSSLAPGDTGQVDYLWDDPPSGQHNIIARIEYSLDQRLSNNTRFISVRTGFPAGAIIINEIMYEPISGQAEYIELYNRSDRDVDLARWRVSDQPGSSGSVNTVTLSSVNRIVHSGEFFVIGTDTSLFQYYPYLRQIDPRLLLIANNVDLGLNNDGDAMILKDLTGSLIDSVVYSPSWHNPGVHDVSGRSLERINPLLPGNERRNWSTNTLSIGGTPGKPNSIYTAAPVTASAIDFSPNPFSPDGDGHEDFTVIHYTAPLPVSMVRMRVYDTRGRMVRILANNEPGGPEGHVVWDGRDDQQERVRMGMYIVLFESIDGNGGILEVAKKVVVVAAKL